MTTFGAGRLDLRKGDCLEIMDSLPSNSVDSIVCDPPYHLLSTVKRFGGANAAAAKEGTSRGFMGKEWDGGDIAFRPETWAKAFRVLKPGGHLVAFSAPKCQHRMVCAIEDAGFEIRDGLMWLFGTGFPKSHNLKGEYEGYGTALKPAYEPICLARKPIEGTVAANVLAHGVGALNIDACRVATNPDEICVASGETVTTACHEGYQRPGASMFNTGKPKERSGPQAGRWPANIVRDGSDEVVSMFPNSKAGKETAPRGSGGMWSGKSNTPCGPQHDDSGSAARFFYSAKASKHDRANSKHPTVKPVNLMRWLCKLVTPSDGLILDPFAGSGTTGAAAHLEGFRAILCEREAEYQIDIGNRLRELCGEDPSWLSIETPPWLKTQEAAE
jgi:site-specific DNA-methyltransferase (adenine-specific)